ncbi:MAG: MFS transporter [Chloroflexi bacterium]|nr:MFS transporter [Chloroflexota bacterium]
MTDSLSEVARPLQKPRFFYGYRIMAASFLLVFVNAGCGFFAFSLFVKSLQADMGWSRGAIMLAFTFFYMAIATASPFVGRLLDRYDAKRVILAGALLAALGYVLLSQMKEIWQMYLSYGIVGLGMTGVGFVPASALVSNWFKKRRGLAIGLMSSGVGAGGFALAPLNGGYIIPNFGWSVGYITLAVIILIIVVPLALFVVRTRPSDMGLFPDGAESLETDSNQIKDGLTLKKAWGTSALWLIAVSFLTSQFGQVGVIQNQFPHLEDIGFPVTAAAAGLGAVGLGSAVGKFFFGWLCDHILPKYACFIGLCLQAAGLLVLLNIGPDSSLAMVWLYAILMGLGAGSWLPTMSMLTSTTFGMASYGAIFGVMSFAQSTGTGTGPLVAGLIFDATGSYQRAFIIFLAMFGISIPAILAVRRPVSGIKS